jgi:hypothetical protein
MPNTTTDHTLLTVQQLSRYLGFRSLKNWDILYNVCQPTFSLTQSSEIPLELGAVANIRKSCQNKLQSHALLNTWKWYIVTLDMVTVSMLGMAHCIVFY